MPDFSWDSAAKCRVRIVSNCSTPGVWSETASLALNCPTSLLLP